jgi:8-oxo-dGTP pyrophosphatase MutT (NUDIX family)
MLIHVSEESDIKRFEPRPSEYTAECVVWAIDPTRLCNYLVPRDCPRVTYYAGRTTSPADVERFLGSSQAVVAVESDWWDRVLSCHLYCYYLPQETFQCIDECAGYFLSRDVVVPARVQLVNDPVTELLRLGTEVRFMPELWPLRDAVVASTLSYSLIRMRNARLRQSPALPEFGILDPGATYMLRPGGYAVIVTAAGDVAAVSTPQGLMLPGGGQDDGESPEGAAIREVKEECGLRIKIGRRIGVADELLYAPAERIHYRKRCTFFLADLIGGDAVGEPDHKLIWLPLRDAAVRLLHESQRWAVVEADRPTDSA